MTIRELKKIISTLPEETVLQLGEDELNNVKNIVVQFHEDGRTRLVFSDLE